MRAAAAGQIKRLGAEEPQPESASADASKIGRTGMRVMDQSDSVVRTVAQRLVRRSLAAAQPDCFGGRRLVFNWREARLLVAPVAEGLAFGLSTGTPPIGPALDHVG